MRTELIAALTTALSSTGIGITSELPWTSAGDPLYMKNMKRVYVAAEEVENTVLVPVLNGADIRRNEIIVRAYLAVDAKNQPSGLSSAITAITNARDTQLISTAYERLVDQTTDFSGDVLIYTFEYRFMKIE